MEIKQRKMKTKFVNSKLCKSDGFTMIELIITIVIVGVIASTLVVVLKSGADTIGGAMSRKALVSEATVGFQMFSRETRLIHTIYNANAKNFQFTTTTNPSVLIDYDINNDGTLTRKQGTGSKKLAARNIDYNNSSLYYYDINGAVGTPIRCIRLSLLFTRNNDTTRYTIDITPESLREL